MYNLLLEFGESDLEVFFGDHLPPVLQTEVEGFWKALFEVVDAVADIHDGKTDTGGVYEEFEGLVFTSQVLLPPQSHSFRCHADIKPENIISVRGRFKLADLGFAKFVRKGEDYKKTFLYGGTEAFGMRKNKRCYSV
jgi:serine/threonine protein kinase